MCWRTQFDTGRAPFCIKSASERHCPCYCSGTMEVCNMRLISLYRNRTYRNCKHEICSKATSHSDFWRVEVYFINNIWCFRSLYSTVLRIECPIHMKMLVHFLVTTSIGRYHSHSFAPKMLDQNPYSEFFEQ